MGLHDKSFPGESEAYRSARDELLQAEAELREQIERVAQKRRELPLGGRVEEDYAFETRISTGGESTVRLSELFLPGKDTLLVYNFMYGPAMEKPCPMCTAIIDGLDVNHRHVSQRANLVVVARSRIDRIEGIRVEASDVDYLDIRFNAPLADCFRANAESLGREFFPIDELPASMAGSTVGAPKTS